MIKYEYNKQTNIVETTFSDIVNIEDMINYIRAIREDDSLPKRIRILSDGTKAKFGEKVSKKDLAVFLEENKITLKQKDITDAFIVKGTTEVALGFIYKELNSIKNYRFEVFSTREAAKDWLLQF